MKLGQHQTEIPGARTINNVHEQCAPSSADDSESEQLHVCLSGSLVAFGSKALQLRRELMQWNCVASLL